MPLVSLASLASQAVATMRDRCLRWTSLTSVTSVTSVTLRLENVRFADPVCQFFGLLPIFPGEAQIGSIGIFPR